MKIDPEEGELSESEEEEQQHVLTTELQLRTTGLKRLSTSTLQLNFMRRTNNQLISIERKKQKRIEDPHRVYPTVLNSEEDPVP